MVGVFSLQAEQKARIDEKKQERLAKHAGMNLYVKNLADDVDDEDLANEFSQFGRSHRLTCVKCKSWVWLFERLKTIQDNASTKI